MPLFERGTTFVDFRAENIQGKKPKYFIGLNSAEYADDLIVCFVFNTERRMDLVDCLGCNKNKLRYVIAPDTFSFIKNYTSVNLIACCYTLDEILSNRHITILETAPDELYRKIKNCLDRKHIEIKFMKIIDECFKAS